MKNGLLAFFLVSCSFQASAQIFGPVGSKWVYCYAVNAVGGAAGLDTLVLESIAETQFDSLPCRELRITYCYSNGNSGCGLVAQLMVCQDDKQVYYREGDSLHLLYDFAALPGDTLRIRYPLALDTFNRQAIDSAFYAHPSRRHFDVAIVDTMTLVLNGQSRRAQTFARIDMEGDYFNASWAGGQFIEGIGSTAGWLLPRAIGGLQEEHIPFDLISFVAPANAYSFGNTANPCVVAASASPSSEVALSVSPTAFQHYLFVSFQTTLRAPVFHLYDPMGRLVLERPLDSDITELETTSLPPGFYAWMVTAKGDRIKSGKCVKLAE